MKNHKRRKTYLLLRISLLLILLFFLYSVPSSSQKVFASEDNLILNSSLELGAESPDNWHFNSWGDISASAIYSNEEGSSGKAVGVEVSNHNSGDAKWFHEPVQIVPGEEYQYSNKYKASVDTRIVARFSLTGGGYRYVDIISIVSSTDWVQTQLIFTAPSDAYEVTMFHLIDSVGELWTDDHSLSLHEPIPPEPPIDPANFVLNPSVENNTNGLPNDWYKNKWGNNQATFVYDSDANSGERSLYISMTNYTSGDAKWYPKPFIVEPGVKYIFTNNYKSAISTSLVARYTKSDGSFDYEYLKTVVSSTDWSYNTAEIIPPEDTVKATVFHLIAGVGELWIDDFSFEKDLDEPVDPPLEDQYIPNSSLELSLIDNPVHWYTNSWGNNTASFEYLNTGYNGIHSVKTTISSYKYGDAKWYHDWVELTPSATYTISDYYKSDLTTEVWIAVLMNDQSIWYVQLGKPQPSEDWRQFNGIFTMPENGLKARIFHVLKGVGFLITDLYSIREYQPVPLERALLTLTFDDTGWMDVENTLPIMQQYGFRSTQYYLSNAIKNYYGGEAAATQMVKDFANAGHEIGSHSVTHPDLTTISPSELVNELNDSKQYLEGVIQSEVDHFAAPYGSYDQSVISEIMNYYSSHRTIDSGFNSKDNFDLTQLKVQNIYSSTTTSELINWIHQAQLNKTWLILVYHRVVDDPTIYDATPAQFENQISAVNDSGIAVLTIGEAIAEIQGQL